MPFPHPHRYSLADLAKRWGQSLAYVEDLIRTCQFRRIVYTTDRDHAVQTETFYFDKSLWPHGDRGWVAPRSGYIETLVTELHEFVWSSQAKVSVLRDDVEHFEKEHGIGDQHDPPDRAVAYHSRLMRIALAASDDLYGRKQIRPGRAHKAQIIEWVKKHYPALRPNALETIAVIVNHNKAGGYPSRE
jgi:hypothetical protein